MRSGRQYRGRKFPELAVLRNLRRDPTAVIRPLFVATRLEKYLWPLPIVYSSLSILLGCIVWLIFFNRI